MGVALNATPLSAPAGINDILSNYIIAAFDDCGGHINSAEGYHYHAASLSENRIIGCFHGETAGDIGGDDRPPRGCLKASRVLLSLVSDSPAGLRVS